MPNITGLPLETVRTLTVAQIKMAINTWLTATFPTKREFILWLFDYPTVATPPVIAYNAEGQVVSMIEAHYDTETNTRVGGRRTQWAYFPTGEIRFIQRKEYDADEHEIIGAGLLVEHYIDGRQPKWTII